MAEEFVFTWRNAPQLVDSLTLPEDLRPDVLRRLRHASDTTVHYWRFMDANGLPVNFPLRLVSDTRPSSKHNEPAHLGLGPVVALDTDDKPVDVDEDEL